MAFLIDEQKLMEDTVFQYENRLNSQVSRFLDKSPTFVTYYHININETTIDDGFRDIESIVGERSPLRFQKIENLPIYGLEAVILSIQDSEQGLDTEYEGEAVILPNTIKPLQNDFFLINYLKESFIFRVTAISYDSIRPDNYYKITYRFEWLDAKKEEELNKQVEEKFTCILQNIGSEDICILEEESKSQLDAIDAMYADMVSTYISIFYSERYNCFLGLSRDNVQLYDPLQCVFMNKHKLLNKKTDYKTIILTEGFSDNMRKIKYEKSMYRFFERRDVKYANTFPYDLVTAMGKTESSFYRWHDKSVKIVEVPTFTVEAGLRELLTPELVNSFKYNLPTDSKYISLMQRFVRQEPLSIYEIPLDLQEELLTLDNNEELYFFTPILLYIIKTVVDDFLKEKV